MLVSAAAHAAAVARVMVVCKMLIQQTRCRWRASAVRARRGVRRRQREAQVEGAALRYGGKR